MTIHWLGLRILVSMGLGASVSVLASCSDGDDGDHSCAEGTAKEVAPGCTIAPGGENDYSIVCVAYANACPDSTDDGLRDLLDRDTSRELNGVSCGPFAPGEVVLEGEKTPRGGTTGVGGAGGSGGAGGAAGGAGGSAGGAAGAGGSAGGAGGSAGGAGGSGGAAPEANCCYIVSEANGNCVGGRPYRVDGVARVAEVVRSEAWLLQPLAMVETSRVLSSEERETLSLAWGIDASTEHASIASFARFALELLAVGAPSHLLAGASEAMRDEIAHARACYAIASRFAGSPMGPGALGTDAPAAQDLASITRACVLEGCIGETVAALRAERALVHVIDEEVRETLSMIVRDEGRHAELAWQFVRWAIAEGGEQIERVVAEAFEEARPRRSTGALEEAPRFMAEHGQLGAREQRDVEEAAWRMVIEPCRAQLTAASSEQVASLS